MQKASVFTECLMNCTEGIVESGEKDEQLISKQAKIKLNQTFPMKSFISLAFCKENSKAKTEKREFPSPPPFELHCMWQGTKKETAAATKGEITIIYF